MPIHDDAQGTQANAPMPDAIDASSTRRVFLRHAGALTLTIPGAGALLTACQPQPAQQEEDTAQAAARPGERRPEHEMPGQAPQQPPARVAIPANAPEYRRYDPALPPLSSERTLRLNWRASEAPIRIAPDRVVNGWTFENDIPGPIVHCRVGDTVEFTLTNDGVVPHSMDFHAAQVDPKVAFRSVAKAESVTFRFQQR